MLIGYARVSTQETREQSPEKRRRTPLTTFWAAETQLGEPPHCVRSRLRRMQAPQRSSETPRLACKIAPICLIPLKRDLLSKQGVSVKRDRIHFIKGNPGGAIPRFAKRRRMDLVVMGTVARSGIDGFLIGNTAEKVVSKLGCSLLAVKPDDFVSPVRLKA